MTLASAAWAIDGALLSSALARYDTFAGTQGAQGIVNKGDLKVLPLAVPGVGIRINAGVGIVLNGYQRPNINQSYIVTNEGQHTVTAGEMPPVSSAARSFIVAVSVGDPSFSQSGHPWMTSDMPPAGQESTFQYVRPVLVQVPSGATSLDVGYPALVLARIDIPASTSTITADMITDLRALAQPRSETKISHVTAVSDNVLNGQGGDHTVYEKFPGVDVLTVRIPAWAVTAKVIGFIEGIVVRKEGNAFFRARLVNGGATPNSNVSEKQLYSGTTVIVDDNNWLGRRNYQVGGEITIPENLRGTQQTFIVEARPGNTASKGAFSTAQGQTSALLQVVFEEVPT